MGPASIHRTNSRRPNGRPIGTVCAGALLVAMLASAAQAVTVHMDENTLVDLRAPAGSVIIGNPSIADVSLITPRRLAILGRSYGMTNVIITDRMGHPLLSQQINVAPAETGRVSVYRGTWVHNFACSPRCERTPMAGEEKTTVYEEFANPYKDYGERARTDATGQSPQGGGAP